MGTLSIWHWLILLSIILAPIGAVLYLRKTTQSEPQKFLSLRVTAPGLMAAVLVASYGKPAIDLVAKLFNFSDDARDLLLGVASPLLIISLVVSLSQSALFYFKIIANLNLFLKRKLASPSKAAALCFIPFANMVALPYFLSVAYYNSSSLNEEHRISSLTAFGTVIAACAAAIAAIMLGGGRQWGASKDGDLLIQVVAAALSMVSGAIIAMVLRRIANRQEAYYAAVRSAQV